jgi:cysteine desulfurase
MSGNIYLDYCATTPIQPEVREAIRPTLDELFGNASSLHSEGQTAAEALQQARLQVAEGIGCRPHEVYFTSGATEADNLALFGILRNHPPGSAHLITTSVEHHAVLHAAEQLESEGYTVTYLPVDSQGLVSPRAVRAAIRPDTVLISVMMVNNEVGAIQPISDIGRIAQEKGVLLHSDAVQGLGLLEVNVEKLGVDLLSLSAHKIYGPKGIGALYVREGVTVRPLLYGGTQENALRPGTENIPGIVGLGAAVAFTSQHKGKEYDRLRGLRQRLVEGLRRAIPSVIVNGPETAVSPHVLSISFPGTSAELMLLFLNHRGIAVSMGSACTSRTIAPSHVLKAMNLPPEQIEGTLRVSLGFPTRERDVALFINATAEIHEQVLAKAVEQRG